MKANVIAVVGFLVGLGLAGCNPKPASVEAPASTNRAAINVPATSGAATNEFVVLLGRWQRGDGGYIIEIRSANLDGRLEAGYFNPNPIHISQAQASQKEDGLLVFVELQDVNYPGCAYKLAYDARTDQLFGTYYQAAIKQTFDVAFGRAR